MIERHAVPYRIVSVVAADVHTCNYFCQNVKKVVVFDEGGCGSAFRNYCAFSSYEDVHIATGVSLWYSISTDH